MKLKSSTKWALSLIIIVGGLIGTGSALKGLYFRPTPKEPAISPYHSQAIATEDIRVREILKSEFNGLFKLDDRWISPAYAFGDLNGDEIEDLVAAVQVGREVDPNDRSSPLFRFEKVMHCGKGCASAITNERLFTTGDLDWYAKNNGSILVVIHGTRLGFQNTRPEQRFVLVDGWHRGKLEMRLYKGKLKIARFGDELKLQAPPELIGSAILLIGPETSGSAIYWDGASYRSYEVPSSPN